MREFSKVSPNVWRSKKFSLLSAEHKLIYLYLLTNPHANSIGCFVIPFGYMAVDLNISAENIGYGIDTLSKGGLIDVWPDENLILIKNWFVFNPPCNPKHAKNMNSELLKLPASKQRDLAIQQFIDVCKDKKIYSTDKVCISLLDCMDTVSHTVYDTVPHRDPDLDSDPNLDKDADKEKGEGGALIKTEANTADDFLIAKPFEGQGAIAHPQTPHSQGEQATTQAESAQATAAESVLKPAKAQSELPDNQLILQDKTGATGREKPLWHEFPKCITPEDFANTLPLRWKAVLTKFIEEDFHRPFALGFWEQYVGPYPGAPIPERFPLKENWFMAFEHAAENAARKAQGLPQRRVMGSKAMDALKNGVGLS